MLGNFKDQHVHGRVGVAKGRDRRSIGDERELVDGLQSQKKKPCPAGTTGAGDQGTEGDEGKQQRKGVVCERHAQSLLRRRVVSPPL